MKTNVDVLVVGAGPVGLFLASELARSGVEVALIDRMRERSFFCKALGVTARTLEIFDDLGIAQDAVDAGLFMDGVTVYEDGVPGPSMTIPPELPFGALSLAQPETERILEACLARHGGKVAYGWEIASFEQDADGVRAAVAGPDGAAETIDCRWLVGCDGAHSRVRKTLGLDFPGGQYPQTFVLADLEVEWDLPRGRFYRFSHSAVGEREGTALAAVPVAGSKGRYRLSTAIPSAGALEPSGTEAPTPPSLAEIRTLIGPLLPEGTRLTELHWSSLYRVSHRIVPRYGEGRVFLAGDAAHLHPPVGGLGMNTGLQDAHNLAWKLALASRGLDAPGLLDSYSAERHVVGLDVVENTSRALNELMAHRAQMPGMRETQLLISYRGSPIVDGTDAAGLPHTAGGRIANAGQLRRTYVAQPFRLHERLGRGRHVVFGYVGEDGAGLEALAEMLQLLRAVFGELASGFAIMAKGQDLPDRGDLPVVGDSGGEFAEEFAAEPGMVWLARPDGYVGWFSRTPSLDGLRSALERIARMPPTAGG